MVIAWRYRYPKVDSLNKLIMERGNFAEVYKNRYIITCKCFS